MTEWLQLYRLLPQPLRVAAACARGLQLRSWRYGPETDRLVEETLERDRWSADRWHDYREERLAFVLHRAATRVPYYRQMWNRRRRAGDRASWEVIDNWPILDKETLRTQPEAFLADDCDPRQMFVEHTSGTTGTPLTLWWSRDVVRTWFALFEARWRRWYNVDRSLRWGILGGQQVTPMGRRKPPFWVWNAPLHQLYLSSYHLAADLIPSYLDALESYRVRYLWGYSSALYTLAREALRQGRRLKMTVAISNAEPLWSHQRQTIAEAFLCPVRETYGMAEIVAAASECAHGSLHLWPEVGMLEVEATEAAEPPTGSGELIATGLLNIDMPLVRYRVGDRVCLEPEAACACGRQLPVIGSVDGRTDDVVLTPDGRQIGRLDPVFKADLALREAQIVQVTRDRLRVRYVPAPGFNDLSARRLHGRLRDFLGDLEVVLEEVAEIPRGANGKFRAVVSELTGSETTVS